MGRSGRLVRAYLPIFLYLTYNLRLCNAKDTITSIQYITDPETVVSTGAGIFKLGFFSPGNSTNRYIGIWYNNIPGPTVVWVANRETPLTDSSGVMKISENGNLVVLDGQKNVVWSTNVSNTAKNSSAELLDSGNLVLRAGISDNSTLWESFDHPTDTFLPTMKLWAYSRTNEKQLLKSWKAVSDPSIGSFSVGILPLNIPQALIWNGSHPHWRSGPWNSRVFIGVPNMNNVYLDGLSVVKDEGDQSVYLTFSYIDQLRKFVLDPEGNLLLSRWDRETSEWVVFWLALNNDCDIYGNCGPFGSCDALKSPICSCLSGFEPKSAEEWSRGNWSGGCVRRTQLQCERNITSGEKGKEDGFLKLEYMKVPDFAVWSPAPENVEECEEECLRNCSCVAYAHDSNGIGCMSWSGNLIDIQKFSTAGVDLYIRVADSELDKRRDPKVIIISTVVIGMVTMSVFIYCSLRWIAKQRGRKKEGMGMPLFDLGERELSDANMLNNMTQGKGSELPLFSFEILAKATNNFHGGNKLGKGGFGEVHKGKLPNGQEIAVKRLSKSSGQGIEEFTNEVIVISKLQHKNLVRLLGCCIEGEEKMLIYEYMPNKSLDAFLFDPTKGSLLDWNKCFHIIEGIIRGLLYLHRDSRLRIIHRDLKASNILLDEELNPKISDFGMARIFGGTQDEANTRRVVGTYGYMSPEYAMEGRFSEKSDVFSFGVLLLEIVSRKRNTSFNHHPEFLSLLGYVWKLWNEDNILELIDQALYESRFETDILKCIHVGLLCIQESTKDRPTMSTIVSMLGSDIASLPTPKQPAYTERQIASDTDSFQKSPKTCSINTVSVTVIEGR